MSHTPTGHAEGHCRIPVVSFGLSLGLFFVVSYLLCIAGYLIVPGLPLSHSILTLLLPGFELLTVRSFLLGLVESLAFGWYVALVFGPLFNWFAGRAR